MAYSKAKLKSDGEKASPFFQAILNREHVKQIIASMDCTVGFI
jgi:hypothetical protein